VSVAVKSATALREFEYAPVDFTEIAALLEKRTGIHLPPHKDQLFYSRLAKRLRALGLTSFAAYRAYLDGPEGGPEVMRMVNALTTNLTRFFREPHHFEHLGAELRRIAATGQRRLRIWSAGCSTGPEPYTLAMTVLSAIPDIDRWDARILATDIDTDVLQVASEGRYDADMLEQIPPAMRRHVSTLADGDIEMSREMKSLIAFKPLNLVGQWPMKGPFDAIFCRNVAIYFTPETQNGVFARMHGLVGKGGHLYIGHSETLSPLADRFELIGQTIYRPR
jgi:chemotaxis protein methyltransferase CheR